MYFNKKRLKHYKNEEKYDFDRQLRLLNIEFLEKLELHFKKSILEFLEKYNYSIFDDFLYFEKYLESTNTILKEKIKHLKKSDKDVRFYLQKNNTKEISNFLFIEKLTFWEIYKIFRNFKIRNKKNISNKYNLNIYVFENWIYASKYIRNICSHYYNLFNIKWIIWIECNKITINTWKNNSYLNYFFILSLFEKTILWVNTWQEQIISLINKYWISSEEINLGQKNNLPSELETEAWKVLVNQVYSFYKQKSNKFSKKSLFSIILAIDDKLWIWRNNNLAWSIKEDMKYFRNITSSTLDKSKKNALIMGRKTWESIPEKFRPLPGRINCILTRKITKIEENNNIFYFNSINKCLEKLSKNKNIENIFVIWWANLYNQVLDNPKLDKIYITRIRINPLHPFFSYQLLYIHLI